MAPIVRNGTDGGRELVMARWGMPGPPQFGGAPITNIRNVGSPHWRGWLGEHNRCIVPATSFCEYADTKPRKTPKWFGLNLDRPLFAFAGLWTSWRGVRGPKNAPVDGQHELFGFLTTEANAVVAPIHPKAMPVILTTPAEVDLWLLADAPKALELQRPLLDDALQIVASGEKEDGPRDDAVPSRAQDPMLPL
jgi:putative SOS response-associated peptidase YedK